MSKVLAVGDIHTKLWIIDAVEKVIGNYDTVVFVGDYADDWGSEPIDSINTWRRLKKLQEDNPDKVELVTGNHDYIYTHDVNSISSGYSVGTQFLLDLPDNKDLKTWLKHLPIYVEIDAVKYSHAGFTVEWDSSTGYWNDFSPLWARPTDTLEYRKYRQVFGHTPSETCYEVEPNNWCIDTFSTYPDGTPVGDGTVLEVEWGRVFNKIKLETKDDNNSTTGISP